ncbi:MAG: ABC transporter ATP-binding protein [Sporolactobacillus sp.]
MNNIVKQYGDFLAVKGISFQLQAGKTLAVLGQNGAGKSTTLKMIYATTPITSGVVKISGIDVSKNPRLAKREIGVVMQDDLLDTTLTVKENMIAHGILFDQSVKTDSQKADHLLEFVGLSNYKNKETNDLSGGMRRRLVLARALINDPKLIILDEPTTGLDIQSRHVFWHRINDLKEGGVSVLLTSHYVDEIERLADDVMIIDHGAVLAQAPVKSLAKQYGYENLEEAYLKMTHFNEGQRNIEQTLN